jgi:hypothetical protein
MVLYISFGRNVGQYPMSDRQWGKFQVAVRDLVRDGVRAIEPDTVTFGTANWGGIEEGIEEENCVMVWFDINAGLTQSAQNRLSEIADDFGQEAIAWCVAQSQLAWAKDAEVSA